MRLSRESANALVGLPNADQRYNAYVKAQDFCICGRTEVFVVDYQQSCKQCSSSGEDSRQMLLAILPMTAC